MRKKTINELTNLENIIRQRIITLETIADNLEKRLDELNQSTNELFIKYGQHIRECIDKEIKERIDDIGMGILKKLVEGGVVNFKEENNGDN